MNSKAGRWTLAVLAHLALLAAWDLFVRFGDVPKFVMPSPAATLDALLEPNYNWWANIAVTGTEIFAGYLLALVVGVALALAFTWSKTLEAFFMPLLVSLNMVPKVALGPLVVAAHDGFVGPLEERELAVVHELQCGGLCRPRWQPAHLARRQRHDRARCARRTRRSASSVSESG